MSSANSDTRSRILDAAWKLLEERDGKVRMADIAKAAKISRQALYLHFPNRAELLVAITHHLDAVYDVEAMLAPSRSAQTGVERLELFVTAWANYIPQINGVAQALIAMQDTDAEARQAWADRTDALRHGCRAVARAIEADGQLSAAHDAESATDLLMMLVGVQNWAYLVEQCGWPQPRFVETIIATAKQALLA